MEVEIEHYPEKDLIVIKDPYDQHTVCFSCSASPNQIAQAAELVKTNRADRDRWRAEKVKRH